MKSVMSNKCLSVTLMTVLVLTLFLGRSAAEISHAETSATETSETEISAAENSDSSLAPSRLASEDGLLYGYEYEDYDKEATSDDDIFSPMTNEPLATELEQDDVNNDLEEQTEVKVTTKSQPWEDELKTLLNPPPISSELASNDQNPEMLRTNEQQFKKKVEPIELEPLPEEFQVVKRQDNATAEDEYEYVPVDYEETGSSGNGTKPSDTKIPTSADRNQASGTGTKSTGSVNNTPNRKPGGFGGIAGNIVEAVVPKKVRFRKQKRRKTTTTEEPEPRGVRFHANESSDYFISHGVDDTVAESQLSGAVMLDTFQPKDFYYGCNDDKDCFGGPRACMQSKSCEVAVSYTAKHASGGVRFQLLAKTPKYVSLGLSFDQKMGADNVVDCVRENRQVRIYRSVNRGKTNLRLADHSGIFNLVGHYSDLWLYCSFILKKLTYIKHQTNVTTKKIYFNLEKDSYYFLLARGNSAESRQNKVGVGYHDLGTLVSPRKYKLMEFGDSELRKLFEKLHGYFFLIGWLLLLPISTFVIRYYKNTCHDRYWGNLSIWFAVHVIINGVVIGLTIVALVLILINSKKEIEIFANGWNHHNVSAILLCSCAFVQICLGIRIYMRRHANHAVTSCVHAILGHVIFIISYFMIYKSKDVRHGLPCASFPVLVTWIVVYFLVHLMLSYQVCYIDFIQGMDSSRLYQFAGLAPSGVTDVDPEPPGGLFRKILLWILIITSVLTTGVLIALDVYGYPDCIRQAEDQR